MAWEVIALTAAFIPVLIAVLLIMFARIFDFKILEQAGKTELVFAASSVFVVIFLIPLVQYGTQIGKNIALEMYKYTYASCQSSNADCLHYKNITIDPNTGLPIETEATLTINSPIFTDPRYSLIELSIVYMRAVMYCTEKIGVLAFWISMPAHWISYISQDVFMAYPMGGWAWGGIAKSADNLLNTIYFMELIYHILIYILRFMDVFALQYILPIGILMRAFPPTRGAGAYVISFSIGVYLIFPLSYLAAVLSAPITTMCVAPDIAQPSLGENSKAGLMAELTIWYHAFQHDIISLLSKFSEFTNTLLVQLCFFPFLALTLTMTFMYFSNGLFGANVPEIGRGLIKLI